jgi:hypothetical protein
MVVVNEVEDGEEKRVIRSGSAARWQNVETRRPHVDLIIIRTRILPVSNILRSQWPVNGKKLKSAPNLCINISCQYERPYHHADTATPPTAIFTASQFGTSSRMVYHQALARPYAFDSGTLLFHWILYLRVSRDYIPRSRSRTNIY